MLKRVRFDMADCENLEHLVGTGYLYSGPKQICRTQYRVDTYLEPSEDIEGKAYLLDRLKEIRGKINPIEMSLDNIFGKDWTLVLEDGRKLDFFITETITGTIIPTTGFRA
jgi:hypothetical protein